MAASEPAMMAQPMVSSLVKRPFSQAYGAEASEQGRTEHTAPEIRSMVERESVRAGMIPGFLPRTMAPEETIYRLSIPSCRFATYTLPEFLAPFVDPVVAALIPTRAALPAEDELLTLREIGEDWLALTKRAFATSTSPWGERWAPNAESTILAYVRAFSGSFSKKTGRLTKSGAARVMGKKPLIGESRALSTTTYYDVSGNSLVFASPQEYAAIQNFGGFAGRNHAVEIVARPFMPADADGHLAPEADSAVLDVLSRYLSQD